MNADKLATITARVRKLLDLSNDPGATPAEAELARSRADRLMQEYQIEEEAALAQDPASMKPEMVTIEIVQVMDEFDDEYYTIFNSVSLQMGVRHRLVRLGETWSAQTVGYESDLRFVDLLYTQARRVFSEHLQPEVRPELSDAENAYRLRSAGIPRNRVAHLLWGASMGSDGAPAHGKVARLYKAECERRGENAALSGRAVNAGTFRAAYARQFTQTFAQRLRKAREGADKAGGTLDLHGRTERIDEAFYALFPEYRPSTEVAEVKPCQDCAKTKHPSGKCKLHRPRQITKADEARWHRDNFSTAAQAGRSAGRNAAEKVALDGKPAQRLDRYTAEERDTTRQIWGAIEGNR